MVCFSNYHVISIFASNDGGTTWHDASGNLEQNPDGSGDGPSVRWVSMVHQNGQELYLCGTSVGCFQLRILPAQMSIWNPEGAETIGYAIVENIDVRQSDGFVAIATQGSGVFTTHVVAAPSGVAGAWQCARAFVHDRTKSRIGERDRFIYVARSEQVGLSVVDVTGKTVLRAANSGEWPSGPNTATFDCSRLTTGSYFVELETVEGVETRRLVIER